MIKLKIDPITRKILGYSQVLDNTKVYHDDILMEDEELYGLDFTGGLLYTTDESIVESKDCVDEIVELRNELDELSKESEHDYFMRLIVDEEVELTEARGLVKERRQRIDELNALIEDKQEEHKQKIKEYYILIDRENDASLDTKYYSSVIMVIKHENRYLKEWLDWHLSLGFDHIYLYDNGMEEKVIEVIHTYPDDVQDKITVTDWSGHHKHLQQNAYEHFMDNFKQDVRWGIFIDSDEFVRFTDGKTTNVNDFLKDYEDYTEIWGYEVEYDANGQETYEDKPVRERFTRQTNVREGFYWKNFVQPNRISGWLMHYAQYNPEKHFLFKNEESNQDLFVIDHYYTKSWEEWQWKIKERGGADPVYHKALKEFFYYNPDMAYLDNGENAVQAYE